MSGSAKAGTTAERHKCELRMLANADVRAPPKRASGGLRFPLTKTYMDVGKPDTIQKRASRKYHVPSERVVVTGVLSRKDYFYGTACVLKSPGFETLAQFPNRPLYWEEFLNRHWQTSQKPTSGPE
jgi:hypothetical protein